MPGAPSFSLPVILAYFKRHSDCLAQPRCYWLLSPRAQISPGVLEKPTGWRRAGGHQPAPPPSHSLLSPRHESFLPASVCQGNRKHLYLGNLKKKDFYMRNVNMYCIVLCCIVLYCIVTVMLFLLGTCCWCVWSLLPAIDWNGAPAAVSDQKDRWHQPTYPTSCLWPFLVLLSIWGKRLGVSLIWFFFSTCVCTKGRNTLIFSSFSPQYLMIQQTPFVRRQVRKLLLFICGSKEKYRQLRDLHTLDSHVRSIKKLLEEQGIFLRAGVVTATSGSALQYDTLISLVSVLCSIIATSCTELHFLCVADSL